ncbi:hypothetical protein [Bradyrhizobium sp. WSM3983]|uniref:hypothetical protein n=1 Tax=Bradyrhizobium sp. WSM3983 TaxID=1038867 RepID=UPI0018DB5871|nr:hypothetical protein [Bradyrhizobium sp. WSM3983]
MQRALWHSARPKKAPDVRISGTGGNPKLKPGLVADVFCKTSAFHRLRSDFLHGDVSWGLAVIALSLAVLMAFAWVVQQRTGNSGWIDTIWIFAVGLVGAGRAA